MSYDLIEGHSHKVIIHNDNDNHYQLLNSMSTLSLVPTTTSNTTSTT